MIIEQYYLSDAANIEPTLELTGLALDELEAVVGYFDEHHYRFAGKMKGEVLVYADGSVVVRHHFLKRKLWTK